MKLICTASKVSWFTVGREYETDERMRVNDDDNKASLPWIIEPHNVGYRTERLEDAEFSVVTETGEVDPQPGGETLLADILKMAQEEGLEGLLNYNLAFFRGYWQASEKNPKQQRAFILAMAYFGEEKHAEI